MAIKKINHKVAISREIRIVSC